MTKSRPAWDHGGKSAKERGYGRQHQVLRAELLAREPLCRPCSQKDPPRVTTATIADHIVPLAKGGAKYDLTNMQPVCAECHDKKTRADNGWRKPKPRIGLDGWPIDE
jgi:5-methylcytosine-specific restriction protein A